MRFHHVRPSGDLGKMTKAGAALAKERIEMGYADAANQLQELINLADSTIKGKM